MAREAEEKKAVQLLRFVLIQPEIKPSDQVKADRLLNELVSEYSGEESMEEVKSLEDIDLSEAAKMILAHHSIK